MKRWKTGKKTKAFRDDVNGLYRYSLNKPGMRGYSKREIYKMAFDARKSWHMK